MRVEMRLNQPIKKVTRSAPSVISTPSQIGRSASVVPSTTRMTASGTSESVVHLIQ